ncbi:MAG: YqgE/AlgH family protein [Myxococcota bacterium]
MTTETIAPGLLLAMPQLQDENFTRSVVLMIEHTRNGSFGLVVNRPTLIPVAEVLINLGVEWGGDPEATVWTGGPVMPGTGWLLHEPVELASGEGRIPVTEHIVLSTSPERLKVLAAHPPTNIRFLMGYSGWGASQLESELAAGSWLVAEATADLVFGTPAEEMWEAAMRSLGVDPSTLVQTHGVH